MAQKDIIFGGIRGSGEPVRRSDPLWKDILVCALLCGCLLIGSLWFGGIL